MISSFRVGLGYEGSFGYTEKIFLNLVHSNQILMAITFFRLIWYTNGIPFGAQINRKKGNYISKLVWLNSIRERLRCVRREVRRTDLGRLIPALVPPTGGRGVGESCPPNISCPKLVSILSHHVPTPKWICVSCPTCGLLKFFIIKRIYIYDTNCKHNLKMANK